MKNSSLRLIIAALVIGACPLGALEKPAAPKFKKVLPATPDDVEMLVKEVAVYPEHTVSLVIYVPKAPGTYPAILDIHGGGWSARQVESDKPMMERLASRGFVTAIVAYRLAQEAKYPAALHDCKSALRYLRANAAKLKLDPERLGVIGGSAGGHLSGLTAMTGGLPQFEGTGPVREQPTTVQACIVMAATMDLSAASAVKSSPNHVAFLGATQQENPALYAEASPITHVRPGVPPVTFIEGEKDTLKVGRAEMQEKLRALGIEDYAAHAARRAAPILDEPAVAGSDGGNRGGIFQEALGRAES